MNDNLDVTPPEALFTSFIILFITAASPAPLSNLSSSASEPDATTNRTDPITSPAAPCSKNPSFLAIDKARDDILGSMALK